MHGYITDVSSYKEDTFEYRLAYFSKIVNDARNNDCLLYTSEELSVSDECTSLVEYLKKFDLPGQWLTDEEGLFGAGYDVLRTMSPVSYTHLSGARSTWRMFLRT